MSENRFKFPPLKRNQQSWVVIAKLHTCQQFAQTERGVLSYVVDITTRSFIYNAVPFHATLVHVRQITLVRKERPSLEYFRGTYLGSTE
jgi:hypothetical protein